MKERSVTLALAIGALALFYLLFLPQPTPETEKITRPISSEAGPNGYAAMIRWLETERIAVTSFRDRYHRLPEIKTARGNLLITTMPHRLGLRSAEATALKDWVKQGNTLFAVAALADTPDWAMESSFERDLVQQLHDLTDIQFVVNGAPDDADDAAASDEEDTVEPESGSVPEPTSAAEDESDKSRTRRQQVAEMFSKLLEPQEHRMEPIGDHPLTAGVRSVAALSEFPASDWRAVADGPAVVLELARDPKSTATPREAVLWLAQLGEGQVIVSGFGSPFTNKLLGKDDNARLLANVVRYSLGSQGKVYIDDAHQGAVSFYDPDAFFGDPRLHRAVLWLLLLWLVFVMGPSRLRPSISHWRPVDITSLVRATGGFLARTVKPSEAGRRSLTLFFNGIRHRLGLPEDGAPTWDWLAAQSQIAPHDLDELRRYYARIESGRRIDLPQLHNLLHRLTGSFV